MARSRAPRSAESAPVLDQRRLPRGAAPDRADAQALAPPDPEVQREILRLELEAEVANLQAEADALLSEAVVEGRVVELPEDVQELATGEFDAETLAAATDGRRGGRGARRRRALRPARRRRRRDETDADDRRRAAADDEAPARLTAGARMSRTRGYPAACPTDSRRLARPSSASTPSGSPTAPYRAGMARPSDAPDGWWLAVLWVADDDGVVSFRDVAPAAGPPPDPPLGRLGPAVSGALSGLILEDDGRLQMRLGLIAPPDDPARPWRVPLALRAAFRFEPARAMAMRPNELAETVLAGFVRAVEGLDRP